MSYPGTNTYTAQEIADLRETIKDECEDIDTLSPEYVYGAVDILTWLAGDKPAPLEFAHMNSRLAELIEGAGL